MSPYRSASACTSPKMARRRAVDICRVDHRFAADHDGARTVSVRVEVQAHPRMVHAVRTFAASGIEATMRSLPSKRNHTSRGTGWPDLATVGEPPAPVGFEPVGHLSREIECHTGECSLGEVRAEHTLNLSVDEVLTTTRSARKPLIWRSRCRVWR